jgi:hypothetical protein
MGSRAVDLSTVIHVGFDCKYCKIVDEHSIGNLIGDRMFSPTAFVLFLSLYSICLPTLQRIILTKDLRVEMMKSSMGTPVWPGGTALDSCEGGRAFKPP